MPENAGVSITFGATVGERWKTPAYASALKQAVA